MTIVHPIPPLYDSASRILILGSFPSVKSREAQFFYGHPQNRFWKVVSEILGEPCPQTVPEKRSMLLRNRIAVWDVIRSCEIVGSSDASIKNAVPNDLTEILRAADIRAVFVNGGTAHRLYRELIEKNIGREAVRLPSTSPANAAWSVDRLVGSWSVIKEYLTEEETV